MDDITDKLRAIYPKFHNLNQWDIRYDAADEIHKLRIRIRELEEALSPFASVEVQLDDIDDDEYAKMK